jgi:excinuclease ABC subunit C
MSLQIGVNAIKQAVKKAPKSSGVYKMINKAGEILYIGKAKSLPDRLSNYTQINGLSNRIRLMVYNVVRVEWITTASEAEALILEANLVYSNQPRYNVLLKDNKTFPSIAISFSHQYPRIFKHRQKKNPKDRYFGPITNPSLIEDIVMIARKMFMIRTCSDNEFKIRKRPCLEYQIKRCSAPCVGKISWQNYQNDAKKALNFLKGSNTTIYREIEKEMQRLASQERFEEAAMMRDKLQAMVKVTQSDREIDFSDYGDCDVLAIKEIAGIFGVQAFYVRSGFGCGNEMFYPSVGYEDVEVEEDNLIDNKNENTLYNEAEVLQDFILQFYRDREVPREVIISHELESHSEVEKSLSSLGGRKINLTHPKLGKKLKLLDFTIPNLNQSIENKLQQKSQTKQNLIRLQQLFNLPKIPQRIEVFDNSHISGEFFLGAMIVAGPDGFLKDQYRRFNASYDTTKAGDDYAMMREVMMRRFKDIEKQPADKIPGLVIIDGGKGQMRAVESIFAKMKIKIPFICMSKGRDRNAGREKFHMTGRTDFEIDFKSPEMYYLQRLRDESHRYVINSHRAKRSKKLTHSQLEDISGIGKATARKLLTIFGSVDGVKKASLTELETAVGKRSAKSIKDWLC